MPRAADPRFRGDRRASLPGLRAADDPRGEERTLAEWMQTRLSAIGLSPINALVDVTNDLTFDRGRPSACLRRREAQGRAEVRRAREGESVLALDGRPMRSTRAWWSLPTTRASNSIAGVMGGEHTGCDETTTRRADRKRAVGPRQHRPDRPEARHRDRCALPLRARRRSRLLRPRRRARDPPGHRSLRRRAVAPYRRRRSREAAPRDAVSL